MFTLAIAGLALVALVALVREGIKGSSRRIQSASQFKRKGVRSRRRRGSKEDWVHGGQSSQKAACYQGCQEVCPRHWGCQEAPPLQTWHSCSEGDQEVSEVHRVAHPQASLPASCSGDCSGLQDRPEVPELCCDGSAGG